MYNIDPPMETLSQHRPWPIGTGSMGGNIRQVNTFLAPFLRSLPRVKGHWIECPLLDRIKKIKKKRRQVTQINEVWQTFGLWSEGFSWHQTCVYFNIQPGIMSLTPLSLNWFRLISGLTLCLSHGISREVFMSVCVCVPGIQNATHKSFSDSISL